VCERVVPLTIGLPELKLLRGHVNPKWPFESRRVTFWVNWMNECVIHKEPSHRMYILSFVCPYQLPCCWDPKGADTETTRSERVSIRIRIFSSSKAEMSWFELATISYTDLNVWCNDYVNLHLHFMLESVEIRSSELELDFWLVIFVAWGGRLSFSLTEFWSHNSGCSTGYDMSAVHAGLSSGGKWFTLVC
jgi:hypothetical protein